MTAQVNLRAISPPGGRVVISVADVEAIRSDLSQVLTIVGVVREDVASLKESARNQAERDRLFWAKDWADLDSWRRDVDDRLGRVEQSDDVNRGSVATLKWVIATTFVAAGVVIGVVSQLH